MTTETTSQEPDGAGLPTHRRPTFRDFWGRCVRASRILRTTRDHEDVTLPRSSFREALKDAWDAGSDAGRAEGSAPPSPNTQTSSQQ